MSITVYTGLMGSGKSFECVSSAIIPAIKNGRRVVTNVDGIDNDAIRIYCHEKFNIELEKLGTVLHCKNDDVQSAGFLPHGEDVDTFCKPGDLICIDEAWRFWGTDSKKIHTQHKIFFREHRHYVDPLTKVSCDLVLMVQDISDLNRLLKVVVELSFRTTKIKSFKSNSNTYRVEMWEGYKQSYTSRIKVEVKWYNKAIFPLYSSYSGGSGKELMVDGRQNILSNSKFWIFVILFPVAGYFAVSYVIGFFNGDKFKTKIDATQVDSKASSPGTAGTSGTSPKLLAKKADIPPVSDVWRITGSFQTGDKNFVVLTNNSGRTRLEHPSAFQSQGMTMVGNIDGERLLVWSGVPPTSFVPGDKK
jgi:zona occludens toxin